MAPSTRPAARRVPFHHGARPPGRPARRRAAAGAAALLLTAWIGWIAASIATAPEPGAADPDALASAVLAAVTDGDAAALQRLFTADSAGPGFAAGYLARLGDVPSGSVSVTAADGVLRLSVAAGSCVAWPVVEREGRRLLDASPVVPARC